MNMADIPIFSAPSLLVWALWSCHTDAEIASVQVPSAIAKNGLLCMRVIDESHEAISRTGVWYVYIAYATTFLEQLSQVTGTGMREKREYL